MKNIDKLVQHIAKYGLDNILIHTIPKSKLWLVAQKIKNSKWKLDVIDPHGTVVHDIGEVEENTYVEIADKIMIGHINNKKQELKTGNSYESEFKRWLLGL